MIEILVKVIIVVAALVVFVASFREEWKKLRAQEREYDTFESNRARRQKECDIRALAVAKRELIDAWVEITSTGRCWHD